MSDAVTVEDLDARIAALYERLGRNIRAARERRGLTQMEAARDAGLTASAWSRLENGRFQNPGLRTLARLAFAWEVPVGELFQGVPRQVDEASGRARAQLGVMLRRATPEQLELIVSLARAVVSQDGGGRDDRGGDG